MCEPLLESLVVVAQILFPQFDILIDTLLEMVPVQEDQLAGHDDESFGRVAVKGLETTIQQLHQFTRITASWLVMELARVIKGNTRLSGVRDHKANLGLLSQCHEGRVLRVGVQGPADHIDTFEGVHWLAIHAAL